MTPEEIQKRFGMPNLSGAFELQTKAQETILGILKGTAQAIEEVCPDGREKACVFTHLEEALFWAIAAIERNPEKL